MKSEKYNANYYFGYFGAPSTTIIIHVVEHNIV